MRPKTVSQEPHTEAFARYGKDVSGPSKNACMGLSGGKFGLSHILRLLQYEKTCVRRRGLGPSYIPPSPRPCKDISPGAGEERNSRILTGKVNKKHDDQDSQYCFDCPGLMILPLFSYILPYPQACGSKIRKNTGNFPHRPCPENVPWQGF